MENNESLPQRRTQRGQHRQARKQKQRNMLLAALGVLLLIGALILLLTTCSGEQDPQADADQAVQNLPDQPQAHEPAVSWMTFPETRVLTAQQYFVYDCDAQAFLTIAGQPQERIYPASVTKLFTAYIAMQYLQASDKVTAGDELDFVVYGSSVAELERGDTLTADRLVEGMLLPSGNDAAYVLAAAAGRRISGEYGQDAQSAVEAFVDRMNGQAQRMGMTGTHFANPDGIHSDDHYTTYADLALWGTLALKNPTVLTYTKMSSDTMALGPDRQLLWENTNELVNPQSPYYCPRALGLKTGQTPSAGNCLLSAFEADGHTLLIGVFGCPEKEDRFADTLQLLNQTLNIS